MPTQARLVLFSFLLCMCNSFAARPEYRIVTASEHGTYMQIGKDLARYVAADADIELKVLPSNGSVENVRRLRDEAGTKLALMQSDVYQAYADQAAAGNKEAARIINPLRVIMPLYDEEIYFIARADSPLNYVHDIQGKQINIGPLGSGSAMSATTIYKMMFDTPMLETNVSTLGNEEALLKLVKERSLDVVVVVAGQPAPLFVGMEPGVEKYFKLLKLDRAAPASIKALKYYPSSMIRASAYPVWLASDISALAVKTLLVTFDYNQKGTKDALVRFGKSLCQNLPVLQKEGHPKWREVSFELASLDPGWTYFSPTEHVLRACGSAKKDVPKDCTLENKVMGLCSVN